MAYDTVHDAPDFKPFSIGITAAQVLTGKPATAGLNFSGYDVALFSVVPSGGANPTIEVMVWDPVSVKWIATNPASTYAGAGADTPYQIAFNAYGRKLYPRVHTIAAGSVSISQAGRINGAFSSL